MRLWVDDIRTPPNESWFWVKDYNSAIRVINSGLVEEISLDHDLGEEKNGYNILTYLEEMIYYGRLPLPVIYIHTANPVGRDNMIRTLRRIVERG